MKSKNPDYPQPRPHTSVTSLEITSDPLLALEKLCTKNDRLEQLLINARKGDTNAMSELFTLGGCHVFAFRKALDLNGTAELMTEIAIPGEFCNYVESRRHAWCKVDSRLIDYFGEAADEETILKRFSETVGWRPQHVAGTKAHRVEHYSPSQIHETLSGSRGLPRGYYGNTIWLNEAILLAQQVND